MGKSNRNQQNTEALAAARQRLASEKALADKKAKTKKLWVTVAVALAAVVIVGLVVFSFVVDNGVLMRNTQVLASDNFEVDQAMLSYFTYAEYHTYVSFWASYGYDVSMFGLDTSVSLKKQSTGSITWYKNFENQAVDELKTLLVYAEAAKRDGLSLTDENVAFIDSSVASIEASAKTEKVSVSTYLSGMFGSGVKMKDVRRCLELSLLADNYTQKFSDSLNYSDDDIESNFTENSNDYQYVDYLLYTIKADLTTLDQTADNYADLKKELLEATAAKAAELAACEDTEDFTAWVTAYLTDVVYKDKAEENADKIQTALDDMIATRKAYSDTSEFIKWAFKDGKTGTSYTDTATEGSYAVYLLTAEPYRDETPSTETVYDLSFLTKNFDDSDAAKAKAEEILTKFEAATKDAAAFDALAKELNVTTYKYEDLASTDTSTLSTEVRTWCFDKERKAAEYKVVETSDGFHFVYVDKVSEEPTWKATVKSAMETEDTEKNLTELKETYSITQNDKAIAQLAK